MPGHLPRALHTPTGLQRPDFAVSNATRSHSVTALMTSIANSSAASGMHVIAADAMLGPHCAQSEPVGCSLCMAASEEPSDHV
jgi:hypothetical protein